jgi:hypothetical protein
MAHTVEIVLIVILVVILGIWFFSARNQTCMWGVGARKSGLAGKNTMARSQAMHTPAPVHSAQHMAAPMASFDAFDSAQSVGHVLAHDIPEYHVPITDNTGKNTPESLGGFQELKLKDVDLFDMTSNTTNVSQANLFSTFEDAPAGVNSTMWPTTAEGDAVANGDDATTMNKAVMPGGAQTVQQVKDKYDSAARNQSAFQLDKRAYASALSGTKRRARQVGEQAGANFNLFAEYLGTDVGRPVVNCDKIGTIMLPEWHPCWDILNKKIEAEDEARTSATGSASMAFRTMSQRV